MKKGPNGREEGRRERWTERTTKVIGRKMEERGRKSAYRMI